MIFLLFPSLDSQRWCNFNQSCQQRIAESLIRTTAAAANGKSLKITRSQLRIILLSPNSVDTCRVRTFYDRKNSQPWEGSVYYSQVCIEVLISHVEAHQRTKARVFWWKFIAVIKLRRQVDWTSLQESKFKLRWFSKERNVLFPRLLLFKTNFLPRLRFANMTVPTKFQLKLLRRSWNPFSSLRNYLWSPDFLLLHTFNFLLYIWRVYGVA